MSAAVFRLVFGGPIMSSDPVGPRSAEVFRTFVSELATCRQGPEVVDRLRQGHQPDPHGWCSHPAHAHRWERYPCVVVRLATLVEEFLLTVTILPWDSEAAKQYGLLRARLEREGRPMGNLDMMIGAHAIAEDAVLVTNDRAFTRIKNLKVVDWTKA